MPKKRNIMLEVQEARKARDKAMQELTGSKPKKRPSQNKLNKLIKSLFIRSK